MRQLVALRSVSAWAVAPRSLVEIRGENTVGSVSYSNNPEKTEKIIGDKIFFNIVTGIYIWRCGVFPLDTLENPDTYKVENKNSQ